MAYLTFLESLLEDAGKLAMSFPRGMSSRVKNTDRNQVVTQADTVIGRQIARRIRASFPDDGVIDEESVSVPGTSPFTWVIDPIDGTSNFAAGSPLFGIMVGVLDEGRPVAGGVTLPAVAETYVAETGQGAYWNGSRLTLADDDDVSRQLIAYGMDIHPSEISLDCRILADVAACCRGVRMSNCIFDCMMVARGAYGAFMHRRNALWDCVAPQVVIEEAGGMFSTMTGGVPDFSYPLARTTEVFSILACRPSFHEAITAITFRFLSGSPLDTDGFC